jgi:hypothetical protein
MPIAGHVLEGVFCSIIISCILFVSRLDNISVFGKVLHVPEFQANSTEAILQHLKNKMKQEDMNT